MHSAQAHQYLTELGWGVVSLVGGGVFRKIYTKISINTHIQKLLIAMISYEVFFFFFLNMCHDTNNLQKPEITACYKYEPDGCYFVIFEH